MVDSLIASDPKVDLGPTNPLKLTFKVRLALTYII